MRQRRTYLRRNRNERRAASKARRSEAREMLVGEATNMKYPRWAWSAVIPITKYPSVQDNVRRRAGAPESIDFASDAWGAKQAGGRDEMTNAVHFRSVDPVGGRRDATR
jgi:hypothetical protein